MTISHSKPLVNLAHASGSRRCLRMQPCSAGRSGISRDRAPPLQPGNPAPEPRRWPPGQAGISLGVAVPRVPDVCQVKTNSMEGLWESVTLIGDQVEAWHC